MDEASARNVIRASIRVMALLDQLVADLQQSLPAPAFGEQRMTIGKIMGEVSCELLNPVVALHPSLEVVSDGAWHRLGELDAPHWLRLAQKP